MMLLSKNQLIFLTRGVLLGITCLFSPNVLANPASIEFPASAESSACPSFTPLTNTISPREGTSETPVLPDSACAKDLAGVSTPVVETTPPTETLPPTEPPTETAPAPETSDRGWKIDFQPYATIPVTVYGDVQIGAKTVDYHLGLGDLLEVLRVTVSGRVEAWNGNFGLIVDGYYASLGGSGIQEARRPEVDATLESALTFDQGIYDFAVSYHLGDQPVAYNPDKPVEANFPRFWFQPYAGTRLNDISSSIETTLTFPRLDRSVSASVSAGRTWFEPLVGGKVGLQVSEPITVWLRGDASGFGLAGQTDMSWNMIFGMDWWVHRQVSLQLAYRFYEINYGNGTGDNAFRFQESFNGPYLSATFRF